MTDTVPPPGAAAPPATGWRSPVWRRPWLPYPVLIIAGLVLGFSYAVHSVRAGTLSSGERIGAWETGRDFASAEQSAHTRAMVALRGLLALPAAEARYYTARVDDGGQPLVGNCRYRVTGGALPAAFWTVTLYDDAGYLVANAAERYSVGSATLTPAEQNRWTILVAPIAQPGRWLPTGATPGKGGEPIALTLRAYLPADGGRGNLTAAELPSIRREGCA